MAMVILLLFALAGAFAWIWNRMESLERRVTELEGRAGTHEYVWPPRSADLSPPHEFVPSHSEFQAEPEEREVAAPLPTSSAERVIPEVTEDVPEAEHSLAKQVHRFRPSFDFEEIFGRLLPIWGGGIALAIAGFFLVRWSIDKGMLTQSVRVAIGFGFGTVLLAAAELAYRFEHRVSDERVRQALAGAGLATLYASFYFAGTHYGLIGPTLSFTGLAAVTALAIILSFRFGLPSAVLGLIGGFAAPALAGSTDPNLPLLATYLALVTGGLTVTGQRQRYPWLGLAALAGGLGWGAVMLVAGSLDHVGILAVGGYLVLVGTLLPSLLGAGPLGTLGRIAAAGIAVLQIAALIDRSGYSPLAWGCYLLLGAAIAILGIRFVRLREAGAVAAALSVCLLAAWPEAPGAWFVAMAIANALIFAGVPLFHAWRGEAGPIDWAQLAIYPIALVAATCLQLDLALVGSQALPVALGALGLAALPALGAWIARPSGESDFAAGPFAAFASAVVMIVLAGLLAVPEWSAPLVVAVLAIAVFLLLSGRSGAMPAALRWGLALAGIVLLLATSQGQEMVLLFGGEGAAPQWLYAWRWLAAALPFGLLLAANPAGKTRRLGEFFVAVLGYGAAAMLVPGAWLPTVVAVAVLGLAWRLPNHGFVHGTLLLIGALWATEPLATWTIAGIEALAGEPLLLTDLPPLADALRYVVPLAAGLCAVMVLASDGAARHRLGVAAASLALVVLHVAYKQLVGIADMAQFVEQGLAERTLWLALLTSAALGLAKLPETRFVPAWSGTATALAALAYFALFSLLLHNPLWTEQAVGSWPIVNLLLPSYGLAVGLVLWLRAPLVAADQRLRPACDGVAMILIALFALSELRQAFSGSVLLDPVGQQEELLRSMLAIAVALGFLGWGARTEQRSWRIGSLVLMLVAVFKVFIFDAAGLEGLARIASFFALGVCLIGIGWFYSRQLVVRPAAYSSAPIRAA